MKKVYSSPNFTLASLFRHILEENGIMCIMKNEHISNLVGEVPANECWPEVWVFEDSEYERAMDILKDNSASINPSLKRWKCPKCGEDIEKQFTECWKCGESRIPEK